MVRYFLLLINLFVVCFAVSASDPTRPLIPTQSTAKESTRVKPENKQPLTAIFTRGKKRYAIIEDEIYYRGDRYRGAQIVAIRSDKVVLQTAKGKHQLTLIKTVKKKN